jgi:hypothetical protein
VQRRFAKALQIGWIDPASDTPSLARMRPRTTLTTTPSQLQMTL